MNLSCFEYYLCDQNSNLLTWKNRYLFRVTNLRFSLLCSRASSMVASANQSQNKILKSYRAVIEMIFHYSVIINHQLITESTVFKPELIQEFSSKKIRLHELTQLKDKTLSNEEVNKHDLLFHT